MSFDDFINDDKTVDAVVRNFEIIGEATKHLPTEVRNRYPDVDWRGWAGLRDIVIHRYDELDNAAIWEIIQQDIPTLKTQIEQIIAIETEKKG